MMSPEIPVSKVPYPLGEKDMTDKAQSMFKKLTDQGYESKQIVSVAARLVGLVTERIAISKSDG
jgi:phenylacetate-coenzyme A ligase PaaK-like adenylate-forming protein